MEILVIEHLCGRRGNGAEDEQRQKRQGVAAKSARLAGLGFRCFAHSPSLADAERRRMPAASRAASSRRRARPSAQVQSVTAIVTSAAKP
ncbi:hypothetical protein RHECNPAF_4460073 [Rhizobium etli CNPAF512]|nr:hypothetical protein RHECNPAF_4460073 [Rhizobium etli CNPAF512]